MGLLSNLISASVKTVLTPVAVAKDVINVVSGEDAESTKKLLNSAANDLKETMDNIEDGDLL